MKNTWIVSIRTSLPNVCYKMGDLDAEFYAFESFEEAREAARGILRGFAFSKNTMFDGEGHLIQLSDYIESCAISDDEEWDDGFLSRKNLIAVRDALEQVFRGVDSTPELCEGLCTDYMIAYRYENGEIRFCGDDDGPCNGYDPTIRTNMFSMTYEKDYYFYIDDMFGQDEATSELYLDLKKAKTFKE